MGLFVWRHRSCARCNSTVICRGWYTYDPSFLSGVAFVSFLTLYNVWMPGSVPLDSTASLDITSDSNPRPATPFCVDPKHRPTFACTPHHTRDNPCHGYLPHIGVDGTTPFFKSRHASFSIHIGRLQVGIVLQYPMLDST